MDREALHRIKARLAQRLAGLRVVLCFAFVMALAMATGCGCMAVAVFCIAACDNDLDIHTAYPFHVETMPVHLRVKQGETVEIRCSLLAEGRTRGSRQRARHRIQTVTAHRNSTVPNGQTRTATSSPSASGRAWSSWTSQAAKPSAPTSRSATIWRASHFLITGASRNNHAVEPSFWLLFVDKMEF